MKITKGKNNPSQESYKIFSIEESNLLIEKVISSAKSETYKDYFFLYNVQIEEANLQHAINFIDSLKDLADKNFFFRFSIFHFNKSKCFDYFNINNNKDIYRLENGKVTNINKYIFSEYEEFLELIKPIVFQFTSSGSNFLQLEFIQNNTSEVKFIFKFNFDNKELTENTKISRYKILESWISSSEFFMISDQQQSLNQLVLNLLTAPKIKTINKDPKYLKDKIAELEMTVSKLKTQIENLKLENKNLKKRSDESKSTTLIKSSSMSTIPIKETLDIKKEEDEKIRNLHKSISKLKDTQKLLKEKVVNSSSNSNKFLVEKNQEISFLNSEIIDRDLKIKKLTKENDEIIIKNIELNSEILCLKDKLKAKASTNYNSNTSNQSTRQYRSISKSLNKNKGFETETLNIVMKEKLEKNKVKVQIPQALVKTNNKPSIDDINNKYNNLSQSLVKVFAIEKNYIEKYTKISNLILDNNIKTDQTKEKINSLSIKLNEAQAKLIDSDTKENKNKCKIIEDKLIDCNSELDGLKEKEFMLNKSLISLENCFKSDLNEEKIVASNLFNIFNSSLFTICNYLNLNFNFSETEIKDNKSVITSKTCSVDKGEKSEKVEKLPPRKIPKK